MARQKKYKVYGTLTNKKKDKLSGLLVQAFDEDPTTPMDLLGVTCSDEKGEYTISYSYEDIATPHESGGADIVIKVFSSDGELLEQTKRHDNAPVQLKIDVNNIPYPKVQEPPKGDDTIWGKVLTERGEGIPGVIVQVFDQLVPNTSRSQVAMGVPVISGKDGSYFIKIPKRELTRTGKRKSDLVVKAMNKQGTTLREEIKYNASENEEINLVVANRMYTAPSELAKLSGAINEHLDENIDLKDIIETPRQQGVTFLARKTQYDARLVAMNVLAEKYANGSRNKVPQSLYYTLFRAGIDSDQDQLYRVHVDDAMDLYQKGIKANLVNTISEEEQLKIREAFLDESVKHILKSKAARSVSSMEEILSLTLTKSADRKEFAAMYYHGDRDIEKVWGQVEENFGREIRQDLQLNGRLGYLTFNNVPLIKRIKKAGISADPSQLIEKGLYKKENWKTIIKGMEIPSIFEGKDEEERRVQYIDWMTGQLALSYPTGIVAERVKEKEIPLQFQSEIDDVSQVEEEVYAVLKYRTERFSLGKDSINQQIQEYELENEILLSGSKKNLKRIHRTYQLSPSDEDMAVLLDKELDSAFKITRYDKEDFVARFSKNFNKGKEQAERIYDKANADAGLISQVSMAYLTQKRNPVPAIISGAKELGSQPIIQDNPTMEELFGSLDFCSCGHCESILSPAAYMVDLLQFLDLEGLEYEGINPITKLLERRPDIENIELTCENTNTVLPYIDLVNEILEYFIIHPDLMNPGNNIENSITDYTGYNVEKGTESSELVTTPQYINILAYEKLAEATYPLQAPFHRNLTLIRGYFNQLDTTLDQAMEVMRVNDRMQPVTTPYAWKQIWNEQLYISPQEYSILTNSGTTDLAPLYGYTAGQNLSVEIPNAKVFCKTLDMSYQDCVKLLQTVFINPGARIIPALEHLQKVLNTAVEDNLQIAEDYGDASLFDIIHRFVNGDADIDARFEDIFPLTEEELQQYNNDLKQWMREHQSDIFGLIFLTPISGINDCGFEYLKLGYANPEASELRPFVYWKIIRFIRLQRKLQVSIEEMDQVLDVLYDAQSFNLDTEDLIVFDQGIDDFLNIYALYLQTGKALKIKSKKQLGQVLALWGMMGTYGPTSVYHKLFLSKAILEIDEAFKADTTGQYLNDTNRFIMDHANGIQAALKIGEEDWQHMVTHAGIVETTPLSIENVTLLFRYAFLSQTLKISIQECIDLINLSGLDPMIIQQYEELGEYKEPELLQFIRLVSEVKKSGFKIQELNYLFRHIDQNGNSGPSFDEITSFIVPLREALQQVDETYPITEDINSDQARDLFTAVYGEELTNLFYATLEDRPDIQFSTNYTHTSVTLEEAIFQVDGKIQYNSLQNTLIYQGIMKDQTRLDYKGIPGTSAAFSIAIDEIFQQGQERLQEIFDIYPEIQGLYDQSQPFTDMVRENIVPVLNRLKSDIIRENLGAAIEETPDVVDLLLNTVLDDEVHYVMHANADLSKPAIADFLELGERGTTAAIWHGDQVSGAADVSTISAGSLNFSLDINPLPANPIPGNPISGIWSFYLTAEIAGNHSFFVDVDDTGIVEFSIEGEDMMMQKLANGQWKNQTAIEMNPGTLYRCQLQVEHVIDVLRLSWQHVGSLVNSIPSDALLPIQQMDDVKHTYIRILKVLELMNGLEMSPTAVEYFSNHPDFVFSDNTGFLNHISVSTGVSEIVSRQLFNRFMQLINYNQLVEVLKMEKDTLIDFWKNPLAQDELGNIKGYSYFPWSKDTFDQITAHVDDISSETDLVGMNALWRVIHMHQVLTKTQFTFDYLKEWVIPSPGADVANQMQQSLRARYDENVWMDMIKPVHDEVRMKVRDALVAYVLRALQNDPATNHIDTPDKLFEYFLIDVEMEPCMKTSRIKQGLSSIQLFINRCLMNLEIGVSPSSIQSKQWEWMKRYRVWEANRKVFLWPENWLDPTLRSTKSSLFRDFEGELLQSDISTDLAVTAIGNYLEKLDRISQLEITGMCREDAERVHVIGHSSGMTREYYHRVYDGAWSAWEKIDQDIEGNPVTPIFWQGRLFLCWLTVVPKGDETDQMNNKTNDPESFNDPAVKRTYDVNLNYTEYYNKKWHPKKTSDFDYPLFYKDTESISRYDLALSFLIRPDETLVVGVRYKQEFLGTYTLYTKHSLPVTIREKKIRKGKSETKMPEFCKYTKEFRAQTGKFYRWNPQGEKGLEVDYYAPGKTISHKVIKESFYRKVDFPHPIKDIYDAPFFCSDNRHVFFVEPDKSFIPIRDYQFIGPELSVEVVVEIPEQELWIDPDLVDPGFVDPIPWSTYMLAGQTMPQDVQDIEAKTVLNNSIPFQFGETSIGVHGSII